ncbi:MULTISPECIES: VOC family protein [Pseudomonas]|uniref:VOC family protein n=1 Tax=Pseudomonas piscis TaxID=2614538 RepID=A0ABY9NBN0_9PSED|nr:MULTISPECIES: VOC family protein [Pseudomonas]POA55869.1 VOC family protein [Pseudomonas sp. FW507-12TSA]WMN15935.1 VOC family protein [Pseudomonas piscis]
MSVKPIPEGFIGVTPYLGIRQAAEAIEFYKKAFGAEQTMRLDMPDGSVGHAELLIGGAPIMLGSPCEETPMGSPEAHKTSVGLHLYVEDVDSYFARAIAAGASEAEPIKDQFYGDRSGALRDPFGHVWFIATRKENLTVEEIKQRAVELFQQQSQ